MKRIHWILSALTLGIPIRASAKCGGVNYSWGADALASMHDYVVTMMLYVLYLLYAIAAIVAVIAALQIYIKINAGEDGVTKAIMMLVAHVCLSSGHLSYSLHSLGIRYKDWTLRERLLAGITPFVA